MTNSNRLSGIFNRLFNFLVISISMAGYVPKNATLSRTIAISLSFFFSIYISFYHPLNSKFGIVYFLLSEILYVGFLMIVLSENGLRHWFIRKWGNEQNAYLTYEAILGFLFFHNLISIGYVSSSNPGNLFDFVGKEILILVVLLLFIGGFTIKILAAEAVSVEIYYLKDMFLGKKISEFVKTGPYKYISNPMYGIGQAQAYATAIWYGSEYGLFAAFLNQALVFTFYYFFEKKFIKRVYLKSEN